MQETLNTDVATVARFLALTLPFQFISDHILERDLINVISVETALLQKGISKFIFLDIATDSLISR